VFKIDFDFYEHIKNRNPIFEAEFKLAYQSYIVGDWIRSQDHITRCLELKEDDGPCLAISDFMEQRHKNIVPDNWEGYRNIDEKEEPP